RAPPPSGLEPVPKATGGPTRPQTSASTPMAIEGSARFLSVGISQRITGRVAPVGISQRITGRAARGLIAERVPPRMPSAGASSISVLLQSEGAAWPRPALAIIIDRCMDVPPFVAVRALTSAAVCGDSLNGRALFGCGGAMPSVGPV